MVNPLSVVSLDPDGIAISHIALPYGRQNIACIKCANVPTIGVDPILFRLSFFLRCLEISLPPAS